MQTSITVKELLAGLHGRALVDVRKPMARAASGLLIPDVQWHHPFDAATWYTGYVGKSVVVFCVHGHEVSQAVAGYLRDEGVYALYMEGGFEAWQASGGPVERASENNE